MRWAFADPKNPMEAGHKARLCKAIESWWRWFADHADEIENCFEKGNGTLDVPTFMYEQFNSVVDEQMCWEFGAAVSKPGHRLVITPEGRRYMRPLVDTILEMAPQLPRWEFYAYRLAEAVEHAHAYVHGRSQGRLDYPDAQVGLSRGSHSRIDVVFRSAKFASTDDTDALNAAFMFCESLLGEEALDKWVGAVEVEPVAKSGVLGKMFGRGRGGDGFLPLDRLKDTFEAVKLAIHDQLPDRPLFALDLIGTAPWSGYRREMREFDDDEPGRDGIYVGSTALVETTQATIAPAFSNQRFSRFGETFCYLKLDSSQVDQSRVVDWRASFEDALEPSLRAAAVGCIFGSGASERYMYIDLAVTDILRAIEILRETMRPLLAPKRSWLLFFEPEFEHEWVGIWDDTPPPPPREDGSVE